MAGGIVSETRFSGLAISPGMAVGHACLFRQGSSDRIPDYQVSGDARDREKGRLRRAAEIVGEHLEALRKVVAARLGPAEAEIFKAQEMILKDPALDARILETVDDGHNAEWAVVHAFEAYEKRLREVDSAYMNERASDLAEVKRRLLDVLCDTNPSFQCASEPKCQRGMPRVVVTEELAPSLAIELKPDEIRGIVTARGGITSHAAILARALGIPAVSGISHIHELIRCGTEVIVNGDTGEVVVQPTKRSVAAVEPAVRVFAAPTEPLDGLRVMANIGVASDVTEARAMKAEGIGLYRTELEVVASGRLLGEEEQLARYADVLRAMDGAPVHFRLLDIGGDKPSPLFDHPREENPSLGLRGSRFLLARPDLLRTQARALTRLAAKREVHVMYPLVIDLEQFRRLRRLFDEVTADLPKGRLRHGVMFEVPSACLEARELLAEAEFASIGTNDLVQYLFAVDRNNERVAEDYTFDRPVFWRILEDLVRAAKETGRPLSICGEMAADTRYTPRLLELGIQTVSVSARHIPGVRRAAKETLATR